MRNHGSLSTRSILPVGAQAEARLIGRIILARWLSFPPHQYESTVDFVTASPVYRLMAARIEVIPFPAALSQPNHTHRCNAVARLVSNDPSAPFHLAYRHAAWGKEFRVDGVAPTSGDPHNSKADWLLRRLRLINTRNRLTHLVLLATAEAQAPFLLSGNTKELEPLTRSELYHRITRNGHLQRRFLLPGGALETLDGSMISRVVRGLTLCTSQGQVLPLSQLLPSRQTVTQLRLRALLDQEAIQLRRGELQRPYTDEALRRQLADRWGQPVARRTVALARQALGIPASHRRAAHPAYPPRGMHFSAPRQLTAGSVRAHAPARPGVYEVALSEGELAYPGQPSAVVYVGRSRNLNERLRAHAYNHVKFGAALGAGQLVFRYATMPPSRLRQAEVELLQTFREEHGVLPRHNQNMPSSAR